MMFSPRSPGRTSWPAAARTSNSSAAIRCTWRRFGCVGSTATRERCCTSGPAWTSPVTPTPAISSRAPTDCFENPCPGLRWRAMTDATTASEAHAGGGDQARSRQSSKMAAMIAVVEAGDRRDHLLDLVGGRSRARPSPRRCARRAAAAAGARRHPGVSLRCTTLVTTPAVPNFGDLDVDEVVVRRDLRVDEQLVVVLDPLVDDLGLGGEERRPLGRRLAGERLAALPGGSPRRRPCCRGPRCAWPRCSNAGRATTSGRSTNSQKSSHDSSLIATANRNAPPSLVSYTPYGQRMFGLCWPSRRSGSSLIVVWVISHDWIHIMRAERRRVDLLPATRALAGVQRGHDAERQLHRAGVIGDRRTRRHRRAVDRAGDGGQPAPAPGRHRRASPCRRRGRAAPKPDTRAYTSRGFCAASSRVAEAHPLERLAPVVRHEHVGAGDAAGASPRDRARCGRRRRCRACRGSSRRTGCPGHRRAARTRDRARSGSARRRAARP